MIVRRGVRQGIDAGEQLAAHPIAAADAEQGHDAEPPQHGRADHASKLAAVLDVAADDQPIAARQAEHVGESEPVLDAAGRRAPIDELDGPQAIPEIGRDRAEIAGEPSPFAVGDEIEAVAGSCAALGNGADQLVQPPCPVLLGQALQLGVDRLVQLARQQNRRVPVDIDDGDDGRRAEQRKIGKR